MAQIQAREEKIKGIREWIDAADMGFNLVQRAVLLAMTVGLGVVAAICALRGTYWPITTSLGGGGLAAALASYLAGRKPKSEAES